MKWNKNAASQKGRVFRSGLLSTAMLAAVLVLAVLLNLLVRAIPAKYTEFDLSEAKMYTLSDSTKALVEGLEKDVHIYYLCETGSEDTIITKLLDHYAAESGHLSWEQKDPTLYPTFAAKYGAENVSTGSLIVTCGENSTVLDAADLYEYDYTDYYTTGSASVTFGGEKQITSAIYKLTAAGQSHAYYTTNHGEQTLTDSLTDALDAQNIDAQPLDLLTSTIPEDCDLLIINAPTSDFTAGDGLVDEISQLQDYLAAGIMSGLHECGVSVPRDKSIVGFDDHYISQLAIPGLTTIHQDSEKKGTLATEMILAQLRKEEIAQKKVILPVHLVERGSVRNIKE